MGERKVLNKYYPPDFDPAKLPRNRRGKSNEMKVRMMLPMSVRCSTCGTFMYKGTKFNTRKEDVIGDTYLGLQIFRFYYRCTNCSAEFTMKTDPQSADYILEQGASRNYEPWRDKEKQTEEFKKKREEEEAGNAMKALENKTLDSKREMDIMEALDDMKALKARHEKVTREEALAALMREAAAQGDEEDEISEEDKQAMLEFFQRRRQEVRRLEEDDDDQEGQAPLLRAPQLGQSCSAAQTAAPAQPPPSTKPRVKVIVKDKARSLAPAPVPKPSASADVGEGDKSNVNGAQATEAPAPQPASGLLGLAAYGSDSDGQST